MQRDCMRRRRRAVEEEKFRWIINKISQFPMRCDALESMWICSGQARAWNIPPAIHLDHISLFGSRVHFQVDSVDGVLRGGGFRFRFTSQGRQPFMYSHIHHPGCSHCHYPSSLKGRKRRRRRGRLTRVGHLIFTCVGASRRSLIRFDFVEYFCFIIPQIAPSLSHSRVWVQRTNGTQVSNERTAGKNRERGRWDAAAEDW